MPDQLQRFLFDNTDIRGELVRVEQSYQQVLANHNYPEAVARLLGEFIAAAALLSATLKFEGTVTLQARSEGQIPVIMAEASSDQCLRAIARGAENADSAEFHQLLNNGQLCITIDPAQGKRYQGIVSLEGDNLASCLEQYFKQSEQLSTRLWLCADDQRASGLLLQELPATADGQIEQREQQWEHISLLAQTLSDQELQNLDFETLLQRLYHQEPVRIFDAETLKFRCNCSRERTASALRTLGEAELQSILAEQGELSINCDFCHQHYSFNQEQLMALIKPTVH